MRKQCLARFVLAVAIAAVAGACGGDSGRAARSDAARDAAIHAPPDAGIFREDPATGTQDGGLMPDAGAGPEDNDSGHKRPAENPDSGLSGSDDAGTNHDADTPSDLSDGGPVPEAGNGFDAGASDGGEPAGDAGSGETCGAEDAAIICDGKPDFGCAPDDCSLGSACVPGQGICSEGGCLQVRGGFACAHPCKRDGDCMSGGVCDTINGWPGFCTIQLVGLPTGAACLTGSECLSGLCRGICVPTCLSNADCPSDNVCQNDWTTGETVPWCGPKGGGVFHSYGINAGSAILAPGEISTVSVEVPAAAESLTLFADSPSGQEGYPAFREIISPSGGLIWSPNAPSFGKAKLSANFAPITAVLPDNESYELEPGVWKISVSNTGTKPLPIDIYAILKSPSPGVVAEKPRLTVRMVMTGTAPLDAIAAATDPFITEEIATLQDIFFKAGIVVSAPEYVDFPQPAADKFKYLTTTEGPQAELRELLRYNGLDREPATLDIFVVEGITDPVFAGLTLGGYDGAIPGPPWGPNRHAGIVVSLLDFQWPEGGFALIIAHEIAHYLGLFHVTERDGAAFDRISDTLECPFQFDQNQDGSMQPSECAARGADNPLFWQISGATVPEFSEEQKRAMRRHPLVR